MTTKKVSIETAKEEPKPPSANRRKYKQSLLNPRRETNSDNQHKNNSSMLSRTMLSKGGNNSQANPSQNGDQQHLSHKKTL
jgi:hypothetical protein